MTKKQLPPVEASNVEVSYQMKPDCEHEELAVIKTPFRENGKLAVKEAQEKAAEIGADYIFIELIQANDQNEISVNVHAYKLQ